MSGRMQQQLYGIGIFEEEIVLSDFTGSEEKRFVVNPEQLMGFFRAEVVFRPFTGLLWMKSDGILDTYLVTFAAKKRTILYRHKKTIVTRKLQLPALAVRVRFDGERSVTSINMWGFSGSSLSDGTVLYELPLPNLSGSSLCLGATERDFGKDVLLAIERIIFDTPFNHHNFLVGKSRIPFLDYVKKHQGRCPLRTLVKIGTGKELLEAR